MEKKNQKKLPSLDWDWLEENNFWDRNAAAKWYTPLLDTEKALALIQRTNRMEIRLPNAQIGRTSESLEGENLKHLRGFGKLKKLLAPRTLDDKGLEHIGNLGKLTHLYLAGNNYTISGLKHLTNLTKLKTLTVEWLPKGTEAIEIIAELPKLSYLELHTTQVTNIDLMPLKNTQLTGLNIGGENITGEALKHIGHIVTLENLMLGHVNIQNVTDDSLKDIQGLSNLKRLTLKGTEVTENGLANLENLKSLKKLQLKKEMCKSEAAKALKLKIPCLKIKDNA